ncbi:NACHT, LRR and PYD domains-containing protein 1, partial [Oryzias melastigma]
VDHRRSPLLPEENETRNQNQTCFDFTPEVSPEKDGVLYRFSGSGLFECSLTGLKFHITQEGEVNYKTLIWDTTLLESRELQARGPLFNIESSPGTISQLHLPHCEHQPLSESLSVLHITGDSSLIKPEKITETHVVVNVPHLSDFGIVSTFFQRLIERKIKGQALLFLDNNNNFLSIHVILLPSNVPLQEVKEFHKDSTFIKVPAYCVFYKDQTYSCHSHPGWVDIQPLRSEVPENYGPNYHALYCLRLPLKRQRRTKKVTITIKDQQDQVIWQHKLPLPGLEKQQQKSILSNTERLQRIRPAFIDRVSGPTLDNLLPKLCQCTVITPNEEEKIGE